MVRQECVETKRELTNATEELATGQDKIEKLKSRLGKEQIATYNETTPTTEVGSVTGREWRIRGMRLWKS